MQTPRFFFADNRIAARRDAGARLRRLGQARAGSLAAALSLAGLALFGAATSADAAPQSSLATDQVRLELLREAPSADGSVRGALVIDLAPGWKTYWIDPGAAGIPPTIDFSATKGLKDADLRLPAPHRFGEGFARSNGYDAPLAAAFTLTPRKGETLGPVTASVMLGVCHDICIPVQATLTADDADEKTGVESAFSALPKANGEIGTIDPATAAASADALTIRVDARRQGRAPGSLRQRAGRLVLRRTGSTEA